jgi:hypothetical protein
MRRKRKKQKEFPQVDATPLEDNAALQELKGLTDEALEIELVIATNTEGWLRSTAASLRARGDADPVADLAERGAAYARIAREVVATTIVLRREQGDASPGQYL